jgi:TetR/AcrR family transcriptional regulator, cholesterol catabolism regulator
MAPLTGAVSHWLPCHYPLGCRAADGFMPPKTAKIPKIPRQKKRAAEILDAAAQVFAQRGFHGASTQDIADVLGVRQASLYYYFPSKEVALEMVCAHGVEGFVEAAVSIAEQSATFAEKLRALIASHLLPLRDRRNYMKVFVNERRYLPTESRRRIGRHSKALERIFEDILRGGVKAGEFRADLDPRLTTLAILGMANAVGAWIDKEPKASLERVADEFVALSLNGLRRQTSRA